MKIAHIVSTYPPYYGGMGNVVFEMASRLNERGHFIEVFTPEYKRNNQNAEETKALEDREDFGRRLSAPVTYGNAAFLPSLAHELDQFDLVHLHYPFFGTAKLVSRWKKRNPQKPLVITYHMDTRGTGLKGLLFKTYANYVMPNILKSADRLIASSFDYIEHSDAKKVYSETKEKWIELPFGVDINRFQPREKPEILFERYGLDPEIPTIIFVGGMDSAHYFKGVPILLEAIARCKNEDMIVQVVLVGEGNLRQEFELQSKILGLGEIIKFVGIVSYDELPLHYAMGDVCVLPSTTQGEAFGMVLIEAMSCGVPVLTSDLPGVRTIGVQGGDVFTPGDPTDLAEAIIGFFGPEVDHETAQNKARKVVEEKYNWTPIVDHLEQQYQKLIAG